MIFMMMKYSPTNFDFFGNQKMGFKNMPIEVISDNQLVIRIPDPRVLRLIARSVLLALAILAIPFMGSSFIGSIVTETTHFHASSATSYYYSDDSGLLPMLFKDLTSESLLKLGDKAVFFSGSGEKVNPQILIVNEMDLISHSDIQRQSSVSDNTVDFVYVSAFRINEFVDRILKIGGIVTLPVSGNPLNSFQKPSNYIIIYIRRFETTFVALKKISNSINSLKKSRKLLSFDSEVEEAKKAALNGLEGVLLEPPRTSSSEFKKHLKRTKYLPDIMGDTLDEYPRRVFIDVGSNGKNTGWFERNYPTRNLDFKKYKIEIVNEESETTTTSDMTAVQQVGISDWLRKNVKKEEYVVMKAEAELVEEMMNSKVVSLVDELFLECKHQGLRGSGGKKSTRRAYWECLALYGRLRDEGVAVHQWWGY
ncbi:hypothetical protein MKX01_005849 [Papaver californicum]|nr:hypothetical protein MKX01_005849 [Papaver californicum]